MKCYIEPKSCTMLTSIFLGFDYQISVLLAKKLLRNFSSEFKKHPNLGTGHYERPGPGRKEFEWGMTIFKHIMLGHETNFRIVVGV